MAHDETKRTPKTNYMDPNKVDNAGRTKLFSCTSSGRLDKVIELIKKGANVNHIDNAGWRPLHEAAVKGQYDIAKYLIKSGASVNISGCEGDTPLHDACKSRFSDCVKLLVENGANVYALNSKGQKPIDICQDECKAILLGRMAQLDDLASRDELGRTRLHRACWDGHKDKVLRLLNQGADTNARDNEMWSPLHCTVENGHFDIVKLLVDRGADINGCKQGGTSVLHIACQKQHETIVNHLVKSGADVQVQDDTGHTPYQLCQSATIRKTITSRIDEVRKQRAKTDAIDEATFQSNTQQRRRTASDDSKSLSREERKIQAIMKSFEQAEKKRSRKQVSLGETPPPEKRKKIASREGSAEKTFPKKQLAVRPDPFKKDSAGRTQLFKNAKQGNIELVEILLQKGANACERDNAGYTPLHAAALHGRTQVVHILLDHNADVNAQDADLDTPLHDAAENGYIEIVQLLLKYGAIVKTKNKQGSTPLDVTEHHAIQEILRKHKELETKKLTLDLTEAKAQASRHLCKKFITQPHSIPNSPPEQWHDFIGPHLKEAASLYTIQHLNELHVVDLQLSLLMGLNDTAAFYARHSHLTRYPISLHDKMKLWSPLSSMLGGGYEREMERVRFLKSDLCYVPLAQVRPLLDHALVTIALDMGQSFKLPPKLGMKMQKLSKPW